MISLSRMASSHALLVCVVVWLVVGAFSLSSGGNSVTELRENMTVSAPERYSSSPLFTEKENDRTKIVHSLEHARLVFPAKLNMPQCLPTKREKGREKNLTNHERHQQVPRCPKHSNCTRIAHHEYPCVPPNRDTETQRLV